jgi:hypothetical protein
MHMATELDEWKRHQMQQDISTVLLEKNTCYVLITCSAPSEDGKMEVEMTYEGDASLAAYLIESAQGLIENPNEAS